MDNNRKPPLVIVAGPTASGKSDAAVELCLRLHGEVISADSMQVYRGMDIGSAKITKEEMRGVPHHLIDIRDPKEPWNVVLFQQEARKAASDILSRGKLPFLVGGTGFYIQSLLYDIDFTRMDEDTAYRKQLQEIADREGNEALHRMLEEVDPKAAAILHPNNVKRVIRALEYFRESGTSIADHNEEQRQKEPAFDALFFVLTMDRERLYRRINQRVDRMMEEGLEDECRHLADEGLTLSDVSMQGLGYRQMLEYFEGQWTREEAIEQIKEQTRHFAKRQLTWFRREKNVTWVSRDDFERTDAMLSFMEKSIREKYQEQNKD
ncbi:MAG TPA: tRNA (adenosine(37)-N6)-dimethylallyltransferase MiaA [Lachnospiraceae bacterium]|jgi:tRNA dimethylallyltransferase|nr:tRNA (adenosine(37)-N6)-dimethylallyltransferase MiaA [Lachnospiraceae bacterium]